VVYAEVIYKLINAIVNITSAMVHGLDTTLEIKDETREVIKSIGSILLRIAREYNDSRADTLKLSDDIRSFFMIPNHNFLIEWLPGPDDDPASTANILQSFIDRVEHFIAAVPNREDNIKNIVLRKAWEKVHTELRDVMQYYQTQAGFQPVGPLGQWCARGKGAKSAHENITNCIYDALVKLADQS
jgi:hypothetical protein